MRILLGTVLLVTGVVCAPALAGVIDTVAGTGKKGHAGDGGPAAAARLAEPFHCDLDGKGTLFIAESANHCIRRVNLKTSVIDTVAGTGKKGYSGDGGPATKATFNEPYAVVIAPTGDLFIVDRLNACVRKVDGKTGAISTVAGTGAKGYSGDGGPGNKAQLVEPNDCILDGKGGLLIADVGDWRIRRLDLKTGVISTVAGTGRRKGTLARATWATAARPARPSSTARAVCIDGRGNTYICEREGNAVRKVDDRGVITTLAGTGATGNVDGPAGKARFRGPKGVRCDRQGNVFVVDTENDSIRKIDVKTLAVTTVAGGRRGPGGDGGDALKAGMGRPHGCILDADGVMYVADTLNQRVRRVKPQETNP